MAGLARSGAHRRYRGRLFSGVRVVAHVVRDGCAADYYADGRARNGRVAQCAGLLSEAACHAAHSILAHRGEWVTNEKQLLGTASLRGIKM
jgi:hypothetical protein